MINLEYFWTCLKAAIFYIPQNINMSLLILIFCVILGTGIAMIRTYNVKILKPICDVLMALCKALPANLILLIVYLLFTNNFGKVAKMLNLHMSIKDVNLVYVAVVALTISSISSVSEVIRSGLLSVEKGQYEAGYSIGISKTQTFFYIILPQAIRSIIPPLTNSILGLMKSTALVSVIGVMDIMNGAIVAANFAYCYFEAYLAVVLVFWVLGICVEQLSRIAEKYFSKSIKTLY
jgi:L-cystine transport system permease protein